MLLTKSSKPLFIGVGGGSASGKSEACCKIQEVLSQKSNGKVAVVLSLSSFYRELSPEEQLMDERGVFDYAHPKSFDFNYLLEVLRKIKQHEAVTIVRRNPAKTIDATSAVQRIPADVDVVIVEGILTFYQKEIRDMLHLKIFIESDADTRLCRKVLQDVLQKGRSLEVVLDTYFKYVKPAFEEFCLPTKKYADVILPRAPDNTVGVDLITEHLLQLVNDVSFNGTDCASASRVRNQSESCAPSIRPH